MPVEGVVVPKYINYRILMEKVKFDYSDTVEYKGLGIGVFVLANYLLI